MAAVAPEPDYRTDMAAFYRMASYPLVAQSDCSADTRQEACDIAAAALERHPGDLERCTQAVKEAMDKRCGGPWHVVVGRAFAFEVTHESKHFMHLFVGGTTAVLLWKL